MTTHAYKVNHAMNVDLKHSELKIKSSLLLSRSGELNLMFTTMPYM